MKTSRILIVAVVCTALGATVTSGAAFAARAPKPKDYIYCVTVPKEGGGGTEHECFESEPFEVFRTSKTFKFGNTTGTYTQGNRQFVFKESESSENHGADELRGTLGKQNVISGTLYENGTATETTFTLTPVRSTAAA